MKKRLIMLLAATAMIAATGTQASTSMPSNKDWQTIDNFKTLPYDPQGDVYVTQHGTKYHLRDCQHIKGKTVRRVSSKLAKKEGLNACKTCERKHGKKMP